VVCVHEVINNRSLFSAVEPCLFFWVLLLSTQCQNLGVFFIHNIGYTLIDCNALSMIFINVFQLLHQVFVLDLFIKKMVL